MAAPDGLRKRIGSNRRGSGLMLAGAVLAGTASLMVFNVSHSAQASAAEPTSLTNVVVATRDIPEYAPITADAVTVKQFPAAYVSPGMIVRPADVVGKYAAGPIVRDQFLLSAQVSPDNRMANLSARVPAGKLAYWLPLPDLMAQSGGLRAGDRVDLLLTLGLPSPAATGQAAQQKTLTTQSTLQNVEVFFVGTPDAAIVSQAQPAANSTPSGAMGKTNQAPNGAVKTTPKVVVFLLDPQDALLVKFMKDSGGSIDIGLRSRDAKDPVTTEPVTTETLASHFNFRTR